MFGRKKEVLTYIFTGFLESGKTSFIKETLKEGQFSDGYKTSYIICEEGMEELDEKEIKENRFTLHTVEEEEDITEELLTSIEKEDKPDRVLIEYNGTWDPDALMEALPENWAVAEIITTIDASTYEGYLSNMKQLMTRQFTYSDLVLFNRCKEDQALPTFKRSVRALNKRTQIIFEMEDGTINNDVKEELPYDINSKEINVEEDDFGIWYIDAIDNTDSYVGKTVSFKAMVKRGRAGNDIFFAGRNAMTCCAEDIQFVGLPCRWAGAKSLKDNDYVNITAKISKTMNRQAGREMPALVAEKVEPAPPAAEELIYFV